MSSKPEPNDEPMTPNEETSDAGLPEREEQGVPVPAESETELLAEKVEDLERERDKLLDRLMRLQAEYDNYRKRVSREREGWTARALEPFVLELLPVVDSFDRALRAAEEAGDAPAVLSGMTLVQKQLMTALESWGIEPIDAVGQPFDPMIHEAFQSRPAAEGETPGTFVEEYSRGFRMGDRVIRATKGVVAAPKEKGEERDSNADREED